MPDENRVFAGAELLEEREPESRASLDVVGEGLVDDGQAEGRTFRFDARIPEVAGRTAAVTGDDDDLHVKVFAGFGGGHRLWEWCQRRVPEGLMLERSHIRPMSRIICISRTRETTRSPAPV